MTAALAGGSIPTSSTSSAPTSPTSPAARRRLDLTEAVTTPAWNWDDFYPAAREAVTIDGKVRATRR